ncbi:trans-aconitate 2-methyltransferase [Fusarium austroafricanum]|uniref:Trans-aconitate 2-methyltransferase n=1 Tax=Fusarium austroafricanum TaxID=2364996 RepID=A0A8H4NHF0_9HYPO|nr:trans-aconitate 2-methyltransferase [Fusarium austroafricanum]
MSSRYAYDSEHSPITASSSTADMAQSNDKLHSIERAPVDDASPVEDDSDFSDTSSNYSTISEDALPLIREYGHTYHGSGRILTPNDASESHRLIVMHELYQLCLNGSLVDAKLPLDQYTPEDPFEILDIGAGNGIWACDMGKRYPQANVLSIDLSSALLPEDVPPNVTFEICDATDPWPADTWDFIHMRSLAGGGVRDWNALLAKAYAHLNPGGQLEVTEIRPHFFDADAEQVDLPSTESGVGGQVGAACIEYERIFEDMCDKLGVDCDPIPKVAGILSGLGAEMIRERVDWLPVQNWGSDPVTQQKRKALAEMVECGIENWTLRLFGLGGWEEKATRALLDRVRAEMQDPMLRSLAKVAFVTARKGFGNGKQV